LLREIVQEEATRGALVIIASHNQEDIELLCDKVIIMADGKISDEYVKKQIYLLTIKLVFQFDLSLDDYIYPNYYTPEKALEVNDRAEIIAVVSPTGRIEQYHWLLRQEVVINKVVRGDKSLEGMTAKLDVSNGLVYYNIDEKRDPFDPRGFNLYYTNTVNIMQPGNEYLAFFNRMPLQDYAEDDIIFNCISTEYSYFNLSLPEMTFL